jgi:hypothetical protein
MFCYAGLPVWFLCRFALVWSVMQVCRGWFADLPQPLRIEDSPQLLIFEELPAVLFVLLKNVVIRHASDIVTDHAR